ncbi:ParB family chromosome partitioning protein [Sphingomonas zeicaulis]|uniref:ParB/RepB/Spo0J family partition protein n=1 Tax=Sphingomonas zeicaulis TaxID=1632740 RepID=UPI003D1D068A
MKLDHIPLASLTDSRANMRAARKAPDIANLLPSVARRGILTTLLVRPGEAPGLFEVVAGRRRLFAARAVAEERGAFPPLPCAILDETDDVDAVEASMIENLARSDADEVTCWTAFARLVRGGRTVEDIAAIFGMGEPQVRRILALGNLLPRIRSLYQREAIDAATIRHLTLASRPRQREWLALYDDPDQSCPTGNRVKAWLFGGPAIAARHALFDPAEAGCETVADLFGEDRYFTDADRFWQAQNATIEARRSAYLEAGWQDVVIVPPGDWFQHWEHQKMPKRKGGRVYIDVGQDGAVVFHEGYLTRREAARREAGEAPEPAEQVRRPEVTATLDTYIDLHRHAAVRAELTDHPRVALCLMVAHAIAGSHLWRVAVEPQTARNDAVAASLAACPAEARFAERRQAGGQLLGLDADHDRLTGGVASDDLATLFERLLGLPDRAILDLIAVVMGETLASGSVAVGAVGLHLGIDMTDWWQGDAALPGLVRDRAVLLALLGELAGDGVASAHADAKTAVLRQLIADHLAGTGGRPKVEGWVPRWLRFPAGAYTDRGGVNAVARHTVARSEGGDPVDDLEMPDDQRLAA